ncbi:MAG: NAD-dependent epimerase/dehydratase family protein [Clostridia bacterium]|nr:NAD-dependent epimerase/dehydratase family protein [Clostridia bacterium]
MKNALVLGGTRLMGRHLVTELLARGVQVTIATRGMAADPFGDRVTRLVVDRTDGARLRQLLCGASFDVVFDSLAYCSNDVRCLLDAVHCGRYVEISTASVYEPMHLDTREDEFDPAAGELIWCGRDAFSYGEVKRQAERAIVQGYPAVDAARVRFPFITGTDDYTDRLFFYVDRVVKQTPVHLTELDAQIAFIRSDEAGKFVASLGDSDFCGAVNAASTQTISAREILAYVAQKTGKAPCLSPDGEPGSYNGLESFSLCTDRALALGAHFTPLHDWIYDLLDAYLARAGA